MYPAPIEAYYAPRTIDEALACLAEAGDGAVFIAGGMSLMQAMKARLVTPCALIDLNEVEELRGLAKGPRGVTVRPMTRYRELAVTTALHGALQAIGDAATTVGDPAGAQCRHHRRQPVLELRRLVHAERLPLPRRDAGSRFVGGWRENRADQ